MLVDAALIGALTVMLPVPLPESPVCTITLVVAKALTIVFALIEVAVPAVVGARVPAVLVTLLSVALMVMSLGSSNQSLALTWMPSTFKKLPDVSINPLVLSSLAWLTSVLAASTPVTSSRPMMMSPPLLADSVLLALMLPATLILPWSACKVTAPPCAPVVSIVPVCVTLATASLNAAACIITWPPSVVMVPLLLTMALIVEGSSSRRTLPLRGTLMLSVIAVGNATLSPATKTTVPCLVLMVPWLSTLAPIRAT